jgi:hypothetical protein
MLCKLTAVLLAVALVSQVVLAQDKPTAPKGPPPRFITVGRVDPAKGLVVFDIQVVEQNTLDQPTILEYPDGYRRMTLGTKPTHIYLGEGFKVSLKKAKWRGADGKEVDADVVAKQLKPGMTVLLSADGAEVDQAYMRIIKADTLVLIVPADELPIPYLPAFGGGFPIKKVGGHVGER